MYNSNDNHPLKADRQILTLGSCFADNIAAILHKNKFQVLANPFGVIYHPMPLLNALNDSITSKACSSQEFVHHDGLWRWWGGHGSLASRDLSQLENKISGIKEEVKKYLSDKNPILILTFGSSYLYETAKGNIPVANCHKLPGTHFSRRFTPYSEFAKDWMNTIEFLINKSPSLHIVFTVSPVRHIKDGLHENNLSKANLLLFVNELQNHFKNNTSYFPAYEIMIDELRDYHYYKDDKIHPNEKAVKYIYEKFAEMYIPSESQSWIKQLNSLQNELEHRPLHPQSDSYLKFIDSLEERLFTFIKSNPDKGWTNEIKRFEELKELL